VSERLAALYLAQRMRCFLSPLPAKLGTPAFQTGTLAAELGQRRKFGTLTPLRALDRRDAATSPDALTARQN
jgi:hypothetical protein